MDACEHDLPEASLRNAPHLRQDILRPAAPDPASGIGNGTVRAKLVAAVLYFDMYPDVLFAPFKLHFLVLARMVDIRHNTVPALSAAALFQKFLQKLRDLSLVVISYGEIYAVILPDGFLSGLHITAHRHHHCLRVFLSGPVQQLSALPVRNVGDGAGIHNIYVRYAVERDDFIPLLPQLLPHDFRLIGIYLTSKIV